MPPWRHSCPDRPAIDSYYPMMWPRTTYRPCPALPGEPHLEKTMAKSHPVREQTQWACVVRARVPLSQGGRCGGSSCQMRSPCAAAPRGTAFGKNDGGIPPRPGTNTMGMRCPGTGSPFPRWSLRWVVMPNAVTLPALPGEPHLEKTMADSHPVREQTQWACVVRARVPLSQGGRCGGSSCQMRSPCLHSFFVLTPVKPSYIFIGLRFLCFICWKGTHIIIYYNNFSGLKGGWATVCVVWSHAWFGPASKETIHDSRKITQATIKSIPRETA